MDLHIYYIALTAVYHEYHRHESNNKNTRPSNVGILMFNFFKHSLIVLAYFLSGSEMASASPAANCCSRERYFRTAVEAILKNWTALQLAVHQA